MDYGFIDEIPQDMFKDIQEIGSGTFSDIFSATHINTNSKIALKISFKNSNEEEMRSLKQEVAINKALNHPFICKYFSDIETDHLKIILMELIEGVDALNYVNQTHGLPFNEALNLFSQLVIAIEYLHDEAHITHRDLKLENIMIDKYNHIRLIDFGFSSVNSMMTTCCGSIPYCAPEILSGQKYTKAADIWSLGVILYAFIDGNLPFYHANMNSLASIICQNEVKFTSNFANQEIQDLIQKMLIKDPRDRITIDEIKKHPLLLRQKLLQIDYKQLFQSNQINSMNTLSPLSKSSAFFQIANSIQHHTVAKEPSSLNDATCQRHNLKIYSGNENTNEVDELIKSRKDFPLSLNKLIESALFINFPSRNIQLHNPNSNYGLRLGSRRFNYHKRNTHHYLFKNAAPLLQPNVNHSKNFFDNK